MSEVEELEKRLKHLLKSKIISSYDEVKDGVYIKDIEDFDKKYVDRVWVKVDKKGNIMPVSYIDRYQVCKKIKTLKERAKKGDLYAYMAIAELQDLLIGGD